MLEGEHRPAHQVGVREGSGERSGERCSGHPRRPCRHGDRGVQTALRTGLSSGPPGGPGEGDRGQGQPDAGTHGLRPHQVRARAHQADASHSQPRGEVGLGPVQEVRADAAPGRCRRGAVLRHGCPLVLVVDVVVAAHCWPHVMRGCCGRWPRARCALSSPSYSCAKDA